MQLEKLPKLEFPKTLDGLLRDKVAIITGASRGIGAATSAAFVRAGAKVVMASRSEEVLQETASEIDPTGKKTLAVATDVCNPASVERLVSKTLEKFGRLDVAFNNAGSGHMPTPIADVRLEDFDRAINANVRGTFLSMKYEIPAMLANGSGVIVNMSSTAGLEGVKGIGGYVAGKHAIVGLTYAAALDYARQNIRVNAVAPGPIYTEHLLNQKYREQAAMAVPLGRVGNREEVANVVTWLCSDLSSFVTGAIVPIDGGRMSGSWFP